MPLETDNLNPGLGAQEPAAQPATVHGENPDREGAMAKADLFKLANYSHKLYQNINDEDQLEAWVQAKITKAADYIASVYHYLQYEMKFNDYGKHLEDAETLNEDQKMKMKELLAEAKNKVREIKKVHAAKHIEEGVLSGGEQPCAECGGTGVVHMPGREVPEATKEKVRKYNTLMKATKAAHKRMDANHNGIPDDEEMEEGFGADAKTGDTFKTRTGVATKTKGGLEHKNTKFSDAPHVDDAQKDPSKKGLTGAERRAQKGEDKAEKEKGKDWANRFGEKSVHRHKIKTPADDGDEVNESQSDLKKTGDTFKTRTGVATKTKGGLTHKNTKFSDAPHVDDAQKDPSKKGLTGAERRAQKGEDKAEAEKGKDWAKRFGEKSVYRHKIKTPADDGDSLDEGAKNLPGNQEKIDVAEPKGKIDAKDFAKLRSKKKVSEQSVAAEMWNSIKDETAYIAEKKAALKGKDKKFAALAEPKDKITYADKIAGATKKETVKESADFDQLLKNVKRLVG